MYSRKTVPTVYDVSFPIWFPVSAVGFARTRARTMTSIVDVVASGAITASGAMLRACGAGGSAASVLSGCEAESSAESSPSTGTPDSGAADSVGAGSVGVGSTGVGSSAGGVASSAGGVVPSVGAEVSDALGEGGVDGSVAASCTDVVSTGAGVSSATAGVMPVNTSAADSSVAIPPAYQRCLSTRSRSRCSRRRCARSAFRDEESPITSRAVPMSPTTRRLNHL